MRGELPRLGAPGAPRFLVRLPGWDDVIHVAPTALLSEQERRRREVQMIVSLRNSPTPEVAQEFARIATEIDNVQDAMVVLAVVGRVIVSTAGRGLFLARSAARAADALNAINVLYPATAARVALTVRAPFGRLRNGRPKQLPSLEVKRQVVAASRVDPGTYRRRLEETIRSGRIGFGWGEALQALQTTDWLFGAGVSLGPVFGAASDSFFGLLRGARFDLSAPIASVIEAPLFGMPREGAVARIVRGGIERLARSVRRGRVSIDVPGVLPAAERVLGLEAGVIEREVERVTSPLVGPAGKAAAKVNVGIGWVKAAALNAASVVWNAGEWFSGARGDLDWETHVELAVAQRLALEELAPYLADPASTSILASASTSSRDRADTPPGYLAGARRAGEASALLRERFAGVSQDWVDGVPDELGRAFSAALVSETGSRLLEILEGGGARVIERSAPGYRAIVTMHDYDLLPPLDRTDLELRGYLDGLVALEEPVVEGGRPSYADVLALHEASFAAAE